MNNTKSVNATKKGVWTKRTGEAHNSASFPRPQTKTPARNVIPVATSIAICLTFLFSLLVLASAVDSNVRYVQTKISGFTDSNIGYLYGVASYNVTSMTSDATHRSIIRVTRRKSIGPGKYGPPENIQTLKFHPTLVDFALHCQPTHCYLVAITSRTKRNVELYAWKRTQFDLLIKRDSFARPFSVNLFNIQSNFYIAIAQHQVHLTPYQLIQDYEEEGPRFVGCAILKFTKGNEQETKYHQFIRLPFHPLYVKYFTSLNANNITSILPNKLQESHFLVFSVQPNWPETPQSYTFIWSSLNDYFWPYQLPRGVVVGPTPPGAQYPILRFETEQQPGANIAQQPAMNLTLQQPQQLPYRDKVGPVEICFSQLERLLSERDLQARALIQASKSIWQRRQNYNGLTNISAQVIVHGNVIVRGSLIESPQISLIGGRNQTLAVDQVSTIVGAHSPDVVERQIRQARAKLTHVRQKLSRAITSTPIDTIEINSTFDGSITQFDSPVKFFGRITANKVIFNNGIANSNVKLNGLSFRQLEYELVNLRGNQDIAARVKFTGTVVADLLEIYGKINRAYFLKDAFDVDSRYMQIFNLNNQPDNPSGALIVFESVTAPQLGLAYNATFNDIRLDDFVTRDNRTQIVVGRKSFKQLTAAKLSLANPNTPLNGYNIGEIASSKIYLRNPIDKVQFINGQLTFSKPVTVNRLVVNGLINRHINISSLLHDSVKTFDANPQLISGYKRFQNGLKIAQLTTEGALNGVLMSQLFNLNPTPPVADYLKYSSPLSSIERQSLTGNFVFAGPFTSRGNFESKLLNGIDITAGAVRRGQRPPLDRVNNSTTLTAPQIITGRKTFIRPLHVRRLKLITPQQYAEIKYTPATYPLVNGLDIRLVKAGLDRQRENPSLVYIDNLEIDGNLYVPTNWNSSGPFKTSFGNYSRCRLDVIKSKLVTMGSEEQTISSPIRISSLRAKSVHLEPYALNGYSFPNDFVLKSNPIHQSLSDQIEPVFGHKTFDHLLMTPSLTIGPAINSRMDPRVLYNVSRPAHHPSTIVFGSRSSINNISFDALQTFILHERQKNSTGETVLQTLTVHGQILAKKVNGHYWPEDIILKSIGANPGPVPPQLHRRIYSPLVFTDSSQLNVENQLVLRGPIQLNGRLNQINLTEFARQSVTYGDKDLMTAGRPLRNKMFMGGITVNDEIRAQGLIDGVNFDEMQNRVVTITPRGRIRNPIVSQKIFMSDVIFQAPLRVLYLNDLPVDNYLYRAQVYQEGDIIRIRGKKTITGALKVNRNLIVSGLINGIDFAELRARAISLSPASNRIDFNKTLTIEGDAFMDNLWINEKNGSLDGVRLTNLLPIQGLTKKDYIVKQPILSKRNSTPGFDLSGLVLDCNIVCSLDHRPPSSITVSRPLPPQQVPVNPSVPDPPFLPFYVASQPDAPYPPRQIQYNGRNITSMRTTPPYVTSYQSYSPPPPVKRYVVPPNYPRNIQNLALRRPMAIHYETPTFVNSYNASIAESLVVKEQLILLRNEIVSLNLIQSVVSSNLVVGFIEATTNNVGGLIWTDERDSSYGQISMRSFLQLDQINFPFKPSIYHLSVGVSTNSDGTNITRVLSSVGESELRVLSILPVDSPNSAIFLRIAEQQILFLLISQDYTTSVNKNQGMQCPRSTQYIQTTSVTEYGEIPNQKMGGVHVYLFHALQNSSSLKSAYFDLYQSIDLPGIDSFENFSYKGSTYALAISRAVSRIYLLILRGYSGFQIASYIHAPMLDRVKVAYSPVGLPVLVIYQTNGLHMVMDSVIV